MSTNYPHKTPWQVSAEVPTRLEDADGKYIAMFERAMDAAKVVEDSVLLDEAVGLLRRYATLDRKHILGSEKTGIYKGAMAFLAKTTEGA